ncbi:arginase-1-like [Physella acuta]|uniref:arginase-1-like n=1 Tax=Physella acuta TaxID=109671 RepID=UPI0027DD1FCA|nr:arginase-1-like [Physella acuta]XP_059167553.1 arginase-1-like [Physella acuta]
MSRVEETRDRLKTIGVLGFPFSKGQPRAGAEQGPSALREAGLISDLEALGRRVIDHGDVAIKDIELDEPVLNVKNSKSVGENNRKLSKRVAQILGSNQQVLLLGGDHSMAIGSIHGHAQVEKNLVVVWVDAHADINTPLTSSSGNIHGMPLSFLVKELERHVPKIEAFDWVKPCISSRDLVYIALRDVDPGERKIIDDLGICCFSMHEVDKYGIRDVLDRALFHVDPSGKRPIHLSFDVDGIDPEFTPSTGTPVPGGLTMREANYIAEEICLTGRLSVVDIAEVNPLLSQHVKDGAEKTASNTVQLITKFFGRKRQGNYPEGYRIPLP